MVWATATISCLSCPALLLTVLLLAFFSAFFIVLIKHPAWASYTKIRLSHFSVSTLPLCQYFPRSLGIGPKCWRWLAGSLLPLCLHLSGLSLAQSIPVTPSSSLFESCSCLEYAGPDSHRLLPHCLQTSGQIYLNRGAFPDVSSCPTLPVPLSTYHYLDSYFIVCLLPP